MPSSNLQAALRAAPWPDSSALAASAPSKVWAPKVWAARRTCRLLYAALCIGAFAAAAPAQAQTPQLRWGVPTQCLEDTDGQPVRVQCTDDPAEGGPRCLVARNSLANGQGELLRSYGCSSYAGREAYQWLLDEGFQMVPAIAEAPPGWARNERGQVFQVTFDLLQRLYVGSSWQPTFDLSGREQVFGRSVLDMGGIGSWYNPFEQARHEIRFLEGSLRLSDLEARGMLMSYDMTVRREVPWLWVTTFFGEPKRYDLSPMDLGWGMRLLHFTVAPRRYADVRDFEWGEFHINWTMWASRDLYDQVRLELGGNAGTAWDDRLAYKSSTYVGPTAALRARFSLGQSGLHLLTFDADAAMPFYAQGVFRQRNTFRMTSTVAYEVIPLALADQPLSLRFAASADYREDLSSGDGIWETTISIGGRFSLWAPALERDLD